MTTPNEASEADVQDQRSPAAPDRSAPLPDDAPEADVQEQRQALRDEPPATSDAIPDDAPEADVAEQRLEVELDEEDAPIG